MFVTGSGMRMPKNARNGTRRNTAFGDVVWQILAVAITARCWGCCGDQLSAINERSEVQILRVHAESTFRQQQIAEHDARALKTISDVEHLGNDFEAISDIERSRNGARIVAEGGPQHLPKIALLRLGGNPCGRTGPLTVNHNYRSFHHRSQPEAFAHQSKSAAGVSATGSNS